MMVKRPTGTMAEYHINNSNNKNTPSQRHHPTSIRRISMTRNTFIQRVLLLVSFLSLIRHHPSHYRFVTAFSVATRRTSTATTTTTSTTTTTKNIRTSSLRSSSSSSSSTHSDESSIIEQSPPYGNQHGINSCFLPLQQLEQDTYVPRIISIVPGIYPSNDMTVESIRTTPASEPAPALGQWTYTFHTPTVSSSANTNMNDVPVQATIALEGSNIVASCVDPIVVIAEHTALNIVLPSTITEPVDLLVLIDRSKTYFSERKFLLYALVDESSTPPPQPPQSLVRIAAFHTREEIPARAMILGQVEQVTIPWLPAMAPTKTGFLEADEYY